MWASALSITSTTSPLRKFCFRSCHASSQTLASQARHETLCLELVRTCRRSFVGNMPCVIVLYGHRPSSRAPASLHGQRWRAAAAQQVARAGESVRMFAKPAGPGPSAGARLACHFKYPHLWFCKPRNRSTDAPKIQEWCRANGTRRRSLARGHSKGPSQRRRDQFC